MREMWSQSHIWFVKTMVCLYLSLRLSSATRIFDKVNDFQQRNIDRSSFAVKRFRISDKESIGNASEKKPAFCNELDCPDFTVLNKTKDYEERLYKTSHWVTTGLMGIDFDEAQRTMFMRLFKYISGENEKKMKIAMTAPVIDRIIPGPGPACENNFTMSFYMSPSVENPPQPSDKHVYLNSLPGHRVFVKQYGGFSSKSVMLEKAQDLGNALLKDGKQFNKAFFYTAGYDSPFKLFNRHNEIWYLAVS